MFIPLSIVERRFLHISMRDWTDKDPPYKNIQQKDGCFQERSWGYQKTKLWHWKTLQIIFIIFYLTVYKMIDILSECKR